MKENNALDVVLIRAFSLRALSLLSVQVHHVCIQTSNCSRNCTIQAFFRGCMCLRMGYLILTCLIECHQFKVCSEAVSGCLVVTLREEHVLYREAVGIVAGAPQRMFTYLFQDLKKKKKEKGNKEINQNNAKGKHQPENSMFFVMLFLWGHLLLAIRLNH